jgi:type III secretion protein J
VQVQLVPKPPPVSLPLPPQKERLLLLLGLLALAGCARDEIVHAADEAQANAMLVVLEERGLDAEKERDDARDGGWVVSVPGRDSAAARRVLSEHDLPRTPAPGLGEVFGKPGLVPTPMEERARYLHALSGELARSVEAIDGVAEARVHLALAPEDPLRAQAAPPPRAAVLVKVRPGLRARVEPMTDGIRALVAGAVAGLEAATVSVVVSEAAAAPARAQASPAPGPRRTLLLSGAVLALVSGTGLLAWPHRSRALALLRRA